MDLVLKIFREELKTRVKTDLLDYAIEAKLLQKYKEVQHPVIYYSYKLTLLELNYNIYNKKLLGIITALKEQRAYLQGIERPFIIKIDYKNLIGFLITKELNR